MRSTMRPPGTEFSAEEWDPDYQAIFAQRKARVRRLRETNSWHVAFKYYRDNPIDAIEHWVTTYDPRNLGTNLPVYLPFVLFERQKQFVRWVLDRIYWKEEGLVDKSRDMGLTWLCVSIAWWLWFFHNGASISFGSRVERSVDKIGDMDSIFEKFREIMRHMPREMKPEGWKMKEHAAYLKILNPESRSMIAGEGGRQIGRGGRSTLYFIDEAAFLEYPEDADKALSANSDVKIWVSTVNGMGNPFARKRFSGDIEVFTYFWRSDPRKDDAWYEAKKIALASTPGALAAEVDIDYEASGGDVVIPASWVRASQEFFRYLRKKGNLPHTTDGVAGLDVGGGKAPSVFVPRYGPLVMGSTAWTEDDSINTAGKAEDLAVVHNCGVVRFDSIGVGRGVASAFRRLKRVKSIGVNVGDRPSRTRWPDQRRARDKFVNLKAECHWICRDRLYNTYQHWLFLTTDGRDGIKHDLADMLLLPPDDNELASQLSLPLYMRTESGKIQIESKKQMATRGIKSPDHADGLILTFAPTPTRRTAGRTVGR